MGINQPLKEDKLYKRAADTDHFIDGLFAPLLSKGKQLGSYV